MIFEYQQYQEDCVNRILAALAGIEFSSDREEKIGLLRENLAKIAHEHNYPVFSSRDKWEIDIQMETGTGKTFTYLNTIYELHQKIGQNKFIIVLPRTAIKLGVIQNIKLTDEYFFSKYKKHLNIINYPQDGLAKIRNEFINSHNDLSILITTNSAFNSKKNKINQKDESLYNYGNTWDGIAEQKPVVVIDEPHLLTGERTEEGLGKLKASLFIRFGATFPTDENNQLSNVAYALDSISAFKQHLVKEIDVSTVFADSEQSAVDVHNIKPKEKCFDINYNINKQVYKKTVRLGGNIGSITGLPQYADHVVAKIEKSKIYFGNRECWESYKGDYNLSLAELKVMISDTITLHFKNEQRHFEKGVKTLSLFFIPGIGDFRRDKPPVKDNRPRIIDIFEEAYRAQHQKIYSTTDNAEYKEFLDEDISKDGRLLVHEGYFSGDRGTKDEKEAEGVDTILNKKEELLSFGTPLRFIFSVWALQEGWDNPNIFNICKLSSTAKETSRRQQVGRGLRIAVNQQGKRLTYKHVGESNANFYDINTLNMVVSEKEKHFVYAIQKEVVEASYSFVGGIIDTNAMDRLKQLGMKMNELMQLLIVLESNGIIKVNEQDEYEIRSPIEVYMKANRAQFLFLGEDARFEFIKNLFVGDYRNAVKDANKESKKVKVRQTQWKQFKELWETINKKSKIVYKNIREDDILTEVARLFSEANIPRLNIKITREKYNAQKNEVEQIYSDDPTDPADAPKYFIKNSMSDYVVKFAEDKKYPLAFILELFNQLDINKFATNPHKSGEFIKDKLKEVVHKTVLKRVSYQFNQTEIYPNQLQDATGKLNDELTYTLLGKFYEEDAIPREQFLYDTVVYDSKIEHDSIIGDYVGFKGKEIIVFAKLPAIKIPTPYKTYSPDFAYLIKTNSDKYLFLVVETKGYKHEDNIPQEEKQKINYARRFFNALQEELPHINIQYKTRMKGQDLSELLLECNV